MTQKHNSTIHANADIWSPRAEHRIKTSHYFIPEVGFSYIERQGELQMMLVFLCTMRWLDYDQANRATGEREIHRVKQSQNDT
jgi:hypothetical protein